MSTEIKILDGWGEFANRTGKESIYYYLQKGDIVSEDIVDNFTNMLPPRAMSHRYLQVGEAYDPDLGTVKCKKLQSQMK